MTSESHIPLHPGAVLREEFLEPLGVMQNILAQDLGISVERINEIVDQKRDITPDTAWLFAGAFGTTPQFWLNLQHAYDSARAA